VIYNAHQAYRQTLLTQVDASGAEAWAKLLDPEESKQCQAIISTDEKAQANAPKQRPLSRAYLDGVVPNLVQSSNAAAAAARKRKRTEGASPAPPQSKMSKLDNGNMDTDIDLSKGVSAQVSAGLRNGLLQAIQHVDELHSKSKKQSDSSNSKSGDSKEKKEVRAVVQ